MTARRVGRALALAAVIVAGAACASLGYNAFRQPDVTVREVRLRGLGLTGGAADILFNVYNPNNFRLDASRLEYKLFVDTIPLSEGTITQDLTIAKQDTAVFTVPVHFTYAGLGTAARELLNTGTVPYRVQGAIRVGSAVGDFTIPYERKGQITTLPGSRE